MDYTRTSGLDQRYEGGEETSKKLTKLTSESLIKVLWFIFQHTENVLQKQADFVNTKVIGWKARSHKTYTWNAL